MVLKNFNTVLLDIMAIASQKLVSRVLLPYQSIQYNRDIFYDEMVSIFFHECHRKTSC